MQLINNLIDNLEFLFSLPEEKDVNDFATSIWSQLEYLLEFTASGQRFAGSVPGKPGPNSDPDDAPGSGGGGSYFGDGGTEQLDNSTQPVIFLPFSGIIFNQTSIEGDI